MTMKALVKSAVSAISVSCAASFAVINASAADTAASTTGSSATGGWGMLISFGVIILFMYLVMIRPQKKKEKETKNMQSSINIGDEIVTIGGIVGMVVRKGDDNVVIETGGERTKLRIKLWAISENTTKHEAEVAQKDAAKKPKKSKESKPLDSEVE